jgi:GntR family transcriptional regulator
LHRLHYSNVGSWQAEEGKEGIEFAEKGTVKIHINPQDKTPFYLQIVRQVREQVASGDLRPGEALPPQRVLAEQLEINQNTVARAYRELEVTGVVTTRSTAGTFITGQAGHSLAERQREALLAEQIDNLLDLADRVDVKLNDLIGVIRKRGERRQVRPTER